MRRPDQDSIGRYFDYGLYVPNRTIYIGDGEGEVDANMHELAIKGISLLDSWSDKPIIIYLNTLGGDWYHGMGIYDLIRACRSHVTIIVLGYATSMGSLILQAADDRVLGQHSIVMIHDGTESLESDCKSVESWADRAKESRQEMYRVYWKRIREKHPRFTMRAVEKLCSHDAIFTSEKAIEIGLADRTLEKNLLQ